MIDIVETNLLVSIGMNCIVIIGSIAYWLRFKQQKSVVNNGMEGT
jgi:hypothetical protein